MSKKGVPQNDKTNKFLRYRETPAFGHQRTLNDGTKASTYRALVIFDREMFMEIRARAILNGTSFAEQVRLLVQWGLDE